MQVARLRHPVPKLRLDRQAVPVHDGDAIEMVGQDPRRQEPGHAATDHDGVAAAWGRHGDRLVGGQQR